MLALDFSSYLVYLSVSVIASVSVGPSVVLAATNGINFGRRKAFYGVLGHVSAIFMLAIVSASGLGVLIVASPTAFILLKYLGIAYLIYVGICIFRNKGNFSFVPQSNEIPSSLSLYRKGLLLGLSNPKALVFFTALFPQFINVEQPVLEQFLLLTSTSLFNAFAFTFGYALLAFKLKGRLSVVINNGWLGRITGSLFIGFATALALAK